MVCEDCIYYNPINAEDGYCDKEGMVVSWNDECDDELEDDTQLEMFGDFLQAVKAKNKIENLFKNKTNVNDIIKLIIDIRGIQQTQFDNYATFFNIDKFTRNEVEVIIETLDSKNYLATILDKDFMTRIYELGNTTFNCKGNHWLLVMDMSDEYEYIESNKYSYKTQAHWKEYIKTK